MVGKKTKPQQTLAERIARIDVSILTPAAKALLLCAAAYADRYTGRNLWVSHERLRHDTGLSRATVYRVFNHLRAIGVLEPETGPRPARVDLRVRGYAINVAAMPARTPTRRVSPEGGERVSHGDPYRSHRETRWVSQGDTTYHSSSPSETRKPSKEPHPPTPQGGTTGVGGEFVAQVAAYLTSQGLACGPLATPRWVEMAKANNGHARENEVALLSTIRYAVRRGREVMGGAFGNYASDFRPWMSGWRPKASPPAPAARPLPRASPEFVNSLVARLESERLVREPVETTPWIPGDLA